MTISQNPTRIVFYALSTCLQFASLDGFSLVALPTSSPWISVREILPNVQGESRVFNVDNGEFKREMGQLVVESETD